MYGRCGQCVDNIWSVQCMVNEPLMHDQCMISVVSVSTMLASVSSIYGQCVVNEWSVGHLGVASDPWCSGSSSSCCSRSRHATAAGAWRRLLLKRQNVAQTRHDTCIQQHQSAHANSSSNPTISKHRLKPQILEEAFSSSLLFTGWECSVGWKRYTCTSGTPRGGRGWIEQTLFTLRRESEVPVSFWPLRGARAG